MEGWQETDRLRESLLLRLLEMRDPATGVWNGELASSALGTALAVTALVDGDDADRRLATGGIGWLCSAVNTDGAWGDTPESVSNLSATLIAAAALRNALNKLKPLQDEIAGAAGVAADNADAWIRARIGDLNSSNIARALSAVYGDDRTFAVPITAFLAMCADTPQAWRDVPPLPFMLALLPRRWYGALRMQVVSYALPALIAVGLCRHICQARASRRTPWGRFFAGTLLQQLVKIQPSHGGFLDAIPLTAFVCLSLRHAGYAGHPVVVRGLDFLRGAARADNSWAIDSNLRVWVTALAVRSVTAAARADCAPAIGELEKIARWLVQVRHRSAHPLTGGCAGGWSWTDLPGGVPDADDTSGALLALKHLKAAGCVTDVDEAVNKGLRWLVALQNRDGGMPTFCRGWGRLPFDRSAPDISAHALSALAVWVGDCHAADGLFRRRVYGAAWRLVAYLYREQRSDGSWLPLWFGHQSAPGGHNPVVGTARVVQALRLALEAFGDTGKGLAQLEMMLERGEAWLAGAQRSDGGWGMGNKATVEESALALTALAGGGEQYLEARARGYAWLAAQEAEGLEKAAPIGLYFSLLWYHEKMYPLVWSLEALGSLRSVDSAY